MHISSYEHHTICNWVKLEDHRIKSADFGKPDLNCASQMQGYGDSIVTEARNFEKVFTCLVYMLHMHSRIILRSVVAMGLRQQFMTAVLDYLFDVDGPVSTRTNEN